MEMPKHVGWCGSAENDDIDQGIVLLTFDRPPWCPDGVGAVGVSAAGTCATWDIKVDSGKKSTKGLMGCVQEIDCVRMFTPAEHCRIEVVPRCAIGIFTIASTEPSAMLKDAWDALSNGDPKADEGLGLLEDGETLDEAVENCVATALFSSDIQAQRK